MAHDRSHRSGRQGHHHAKLRSDVLVDLWAFYTQPVLSQDCLSKPVKGDAKFFSGNVVFSPDPLGNTDGATLVALTKMESLTARGQLVVTELKDRMHFHILDLPLLLVDLGMIDNCLP